MYGEHGVSTVCVSDYFLHFFSCCLSQRCRKLLHDLEFTSYPFSAHKLISNRVLFNYRICERTAWQAGILGQRSPFCKGRYERTKKTNYLASCLCSSLFSFSAMPATRRKNMTSVERSSSESSLYTASGTSYHATDSDASSSSPAPTAAGALRQRRTRKRISPAQLTALENLFQRASHPSQHEREVLAKAISMYVHSPLLRDTT
jgi:hypothetical protein